MKNIHDKCPHTTVNFLKLSYYYNEAERSKKKKKTEKEIKLKQNKMLRGFS